MVGYRALGQQIHFEDELAWSREEEEGLIWEELPGEET